MENSAFEQEVLKLTNEFRQRNGRPLLSIDQNLDKAADLHTQNMANRDFFSHTGKDGSKPWDRAKKAGYESGTIGENIAAGYTTPQSVVNGWINSPGHKANMLNATYNEIGIGHYLLQNDTGKVNYRNYWTQLFGKGIITPPTSTPPKPKPISAPPEPVTAPSLDNRSVIRGTNRADKLIGGNGDQSLYGRARNDILDGKGGNDRLFGGGGHDRLFGDAGNDQLLGGGGKDVLQGASKNRRNEKDVLTGGGGRDRFVLGDSNGTFYDDGRASSAGLKDYALITDFNQKKDVIQLSEQYSYRLGSAPRGVENGQALYIDNPGGQRDELIAVIQGGQDLQLNSRSFTLV